MTAPATAIDLLRSVLRDTHGLPGVAAHTDAYADARRQSGADRLPGMRLSLSSHSWSALIEPGSGSDDRG